MRKKSSREILTDDMELNTHHAPGPEALLEMKEKNAQILGTLKRLPEKYKELLVLRDLQELSYEEIAVITGRPLSWVKVNIYRGRQKFKELYKEKEAKNDEGSM